MSYPIIPSHRAQPTRELLQAAAGVLRERGLARDKFIAPDGSGRVCVLGACAVAGGYEPDEGGYMVKVIDFLAELIVGAPDPEGFITVTEMNDAAKDDEEVVAFLEAAADSVGEVKE